MKQRRAADGDSGTAAAIFGSKNAQGQAQEVSEVPAENSSTSKSIAVTDEDAGASGQATQASGESALATHQRLQDELQRESSGASLAPASTSDTTRSSAPVSQPEDDDGMLRTGSLSTAPAGRWTSLFRRAKEKK